jgi:hypothetical protein
LYQQSPSNHGEESRPASDRTILSDRGGLLLQTSRWESANEGFHNLAAFVGLIERPLYLGSLVAGYPQFIGIWFLFKGLAGYRFGLEDQQPPKNAVCSSCSC